MEIEWISSHYKEDNRIFDSEYEAWEWADGLLPDFVPSLAKRMNVGYATPDKKVIHHLETLLPKWAGYHDRDVTTKKEITTINGQVIYKIWTEEV